MFDIKKSARLIFTGFSMGTADLIPGVSGGTIAFLSGIYEELIYGIKTVTGKSIALLLKGKFRAAAASVPFGFLAPLFAGIILAVFSLAGVLSGLLESHPVRVWAFFFGLVLASTRVVLKRVVKWDKKERISFVVAALLAYGLVGMVPVETPEGPLYIFLSGAIAICAMILPGISGSFILLLLGKYQQVLAAVTDRNFALLSIFMLGCIIGIAVFSRFLSWLFRKHHDISVAVLAGIMLGSVRKIWPWKETIMTRINSHGLEVPFVEKNVFPSSFDGYFFATVLLALTGYAIVIYLDKKQAVKERTADIQASEFAREHGAALAEEAKRDK